MRRVEKWKALGWENPFWELLRYYRSLRGADRTQAIRQLGISFFLPTDDKSGIPVDPKDVGKLEEYLTGSSAELEDALDSLRLESDAISHCESLGVTVGVTATRNPDHHQSSKALVGGVTYIAAETCRRYGIGSDLNPQRRCIWCAGDVLHVSARNLDGAIPGLLNPAIVWEIKEYWGTTSGGSKMSDAVYECQLVGREIRDFEKRTGQKIFHVVFLDGKKQWLSRKSDMMRFIDLYHQGIIDELLIGREMESEWQPLLAKIIEKQHT